MDANQFDRLSRALSQDITRRTLASLVAGLALGSSLGSPLDMAQAKKGGGKKKGGGGKQNKNTNKKNDKKKQDTKKNDRCENVTQCDIFAWCNNGKCEPCPEGGMRCPPPTSNVCVAINSDSANCGGCGVPCKKYESCIDGDCICLGQSCQDGSCCPRGYACVGQGSACCPTGYYSCGRDNLCCPNGFTCGGTCGQECCQP